MPESEGLAVIDCHVHMLLDGAYYKTAIDAHRKHPDERIIRSCLAHYRDLGYTYVRDGGDRWGVGLRAAGLAPEYGIRYVSPAFPIHKRGYYGGFIGEGFETFREYEGLVKKVRRQGGTFIKIMISGIMDFDRFGTLSCPGLPGDLIRDMIRCAHDEGFSVMAHANGSDTVLAAVEAGVDSVEHGAYLHRETVQALAEGKTVWVPTLSAIGNLLRGDRFDRTQVERILASSMENVALCAGLGGYIAPGSDAGAWSVFHGEGGREEEAWLRRAIGNSVDRVLARGTAQLMQKFP